MKLLPPTLFGTLVVAVVGCQGQNAAPPPPPPPTVTVSKPILHTVQNYNEYNGYLESVEMVEIKARVKGYLEKVHFNEGSEVEKGKVLYTIDPREFEAGVAKAQSDIERAKADKANADAQIQLAEAELARLDKLGTAAAQNEKDKAVATLAANKAQMKTAVAMEGAGEAALRMAKLDLEYTKITAPITGQINRTLVTQGNLVGQAEPTLLTTIVRMDKLYVYFDAPERDLVAFLQAAPEIRPTGSDRTVPVEVAVTNERGYPHAGKIDFRENRVDTGTGTVRIRGELDNPRGPDGKNRALYPGLYAKARVPNGPPRDLPVIPEEALMTGQEGRFVYVVGEGNVAQKRTVVVSPQVVWRTPPPANAPPEPGWEIVPPPPKPDGKPTPPKAVTSIVAIESGLSPADQVIVNGLQKVVPGRPVTPEEWTLQGPPKK
jgi:RND family efflux transporter MFP subunit